MVKRYIQSFISAKYVFVLPGLAMGVFIFAFLFTSTQNPVMRYIGIGFGLVLFAVMFVYYKEKFTVNRQLKKVNDLDAFNNAVMIGQSFFLEKRLLGYTRGKIFDLTYPDVKEVTYRTDNKGKMYLDLSSNSGILSVEMSLNDQAKRVAQFLRTKNPNIIINGIEPAGKGTLHSIDPYRNDKQDTGNRTKEPE